MNFDQLIELLNLFMEKMFGLIESWSLERNPDTVNAKLFSNEPTMTTEQYRTAYDWLRRKNNVITSAKNGSTSCYFRSGPSQHQVTNQMIKKYNEFNSNLQFE